MYILCGEDLGCDSMECSCCQHIWDWSNVEFDDNGMEGVAAMKEPE